MTVTKHVVNVELKDIYVSVKFKLIQQSVQHASNLTLHTSSVLVLQAGQSVCV